MKYTVCVAVSAEKYIIVEAGSEEEAKQLAASSEENSFSLCHACNDEFELNDCTGEAISVELANEGYVGEA